MEELVSRVRSGVVAMMALLLAMPIMGVLTLPPSCPAGPEGSTVYRLSIDRTWRNAASGRFIFPFPTPQAFAVEPVEQVGNLSTTDEDGTSLSIPVSSLGLYQYTGKSADGAVLALMGSANRLVAVVLDDGVRELRQVNDTHQSCFFARALDFVSVVNEDDAVLPDVLAATAADDETCLLDLGCFSDPPPCEEPVSCLASSGVTNPCEGPEVSCVFHVAFYGDRAWCDGNRRDFGWARRPQELIGIANAVFQNSGTLARVAAGSGGCVFGGGNSFNNSAGCDSSWLDTFQAKTPDFFSESELAILFVGQRLRGGYCGFAECPGSRSIQFDTTLDATLHGLNIAHELGHNFRGTHQDHGLRCFDSEAQADSVSNPAHCAFDHKQQGLDAIEQVSHLTRQCYDAMWSDGGDLSTRVPWFSDGTRNDNGALRNNVRFMDCEAAYKITLDSSWRSCPSL